VEVRGSVCLVTGATSGIGRATALRLARAGARVLSLGRDTYALEDVAGRTAGIGIRADLSDPSDVDRAAREAEEALGRVDILVNNAAEGFAGTFAEMKPERAERLVRTNLAAPIRLTRALLPGMLARGRGHVVNVASVAGHVGVPEETVYAATKAGLITFSDSLRYELYGTGVGVSVVSPGVVDTPFFERRGRPYDRRFPRPISPEPVADGILRAIRAGKAQVFVPAWGSFPARLRGGLPGLYRTLARRFG
jgi:short-subunit dehydrogenase